MNVSDPIVVLGFPRSGHSMITGLLHLHGAWVGKVPKVSHVNPTGFFTNLAIKSVLVSEYGPGVDFVLEKKNIRKRIEKAIIDDGYTGGNWVFKNPITYHDAWHEFNPTFIIVRRKKEEILASNKRQRMAACRAMTINEAVDLYESLCNKYEGIHVWPEKIISGDYSEIKTAIEKTGMEFKPEIVDSFVDKSLWHGV